MIQTYQGYFQEDGRFISDSLSIQIPTRRRAIVNILDDEVAAISKTDSQQLKENALRQIFLDAEKVEDALTSEEWAEFENLRSRTHLGRVVEL